jgi:hypothetical protein
MHRSLLHCNVGLPYMGNQQRYQSVTRGKRCDEEVAGKGWIWHIYKDATPFLRMIHVLTLEISP